MQSTTSLKTHFNARKRLTSAIRPTAPGWTPHVDPRKATRKNSEEKHKLPLKYITPQANVVSHPHLTEIALSSTDDAKADHYLSTIEDPLWKHVCQNIVDMMGPASFLKIRKSHLGQLSSQDNILNITCENEETTAFVQQYDFVILGSLHQYFPALKQLKAKTMTDVAPQ